MNKMLWRVGNWQDTQTTIKVVVPLVCYFSSRSSKCCCFFTSFICHSTSAFTAAINFLVSLFQVVSQCSPPMFFCRNLFIPMQLDLKHSYCNMRQLVGSFKHLRMCCLIPAMHLLLLMRDGNNKYSPTACLILDHILFEWFIE